MTAREIVVPLGDRSYPVVVDTDGYGALPEILRRETGAERVVLVTEPVVAGHWRAAVEGALTTAGIAVSTVEIAVDESSKTMASWQICVDRLLEVGIDRRTPVVALGGGVLGDVAGFAAATTLRGLPLVQLPTTLLSMVDSSVGGKTGVNHAAGKNLVGAFHQPRLVFAALATLETLSDAERVCGLAEVVKTALLGDAALLEHLETHAEALAAGDVEALAPVVVRCAELKAEVVGRDEREGGYRAVLNAGHTVAHALEVVAGFGALRHGEAVAIGLVAETEWAVREGHCVDAGLPRRLALLLHRLGLPTAVPELPRQRLIAAMRLDKKAQGDRIVVPAPIRPGTMALVNVAARDVGALLSS